MARLMGMAIARINVKAEVMQEYTMPGLGL
jgi:hypothetical protein